MRLVSIVTPCYNEEDNVEAMYKCIKDIFGGLGNYRYEHIFIDNASNDRTASILRNIAMFDKNVKVIINSRNFGHIRSPYHALLQASGDCVILIACDFQDPPNLITEFLSKWEDGFKVVIGVKTQSGESPAMFAIRKMYYDLITRLSEVELTKNHTGFGLYDRVVIDILRKIDDPYPYFRGLISDIGFESYKVEYFQPARKRGISKNNFYTLYDIAMLGITNHSKVPLRLSALLGFVFSGISLLIAVGYFIAKLIFWRTFSVGTAPILIGMFFTASVQLFFIGIIGEYIGAIHTQVLKRPLVIEKERINFSNDSDEGIDLPNVHLLKSSTIGK